MAGEQPTTTLRLWKPVVGEIIVDTTKTSQRALEAGRAQSLKPISQAARSDAGPLV